MGLVGYIHFKKELVSKLTNEISKAEVRKNDLDINNYSLTVEQTQKEFDEVDKEVKEILDEVGKLNSAKEEKDKEVKACKDSVVSEKKSKTVHDIWHYDSVVKYFHIVWYELCKAMELTF